MSRVPTTGIDYTSRDYEAFRTLMIEKLQEKMPEYTDTSSTDAGIVIIEALANGLDILSMYSDIIANDVILPTTQDRKLAVILAKSLGYTPYNQTASEYPQIFVLGEAREDDTLIPKGTVVCTTETSDLDTMYYETMEDLIIPSGYLGNEQDEDGNYKFSVKVQHGTSIYQDVIGTSSGAPLQSFKLNYTDVLLDTLEVYVNEGTGDELWRRVDSFLESNETSRVYTVNVDEFDVCTVEFGNGLRGKIPTSYPNGISADYRVGGGEASNVSAGIIANLESDIAYVEETFNLEATTLGHGKESLESIKENAPAHYRTQDRIVTLQDYSDVLRVNFYDFLDLHTVRDEDDRRLAHIYYMMRDGYNMTPELVSDITSFIAERSIVGTNFDLNLYVPQAVDITAKVFVDPDYDKDEIEANIITYLKGVTFFYGELGFKDTITKSNLESEIRETFDGILSFRINSPTEDIIIPDSEEKVLSLGTITITSEYL